MRYELRNSQDELVNTIVLNDPDNYSLPDGWTLVALPPLPEPEIPVVITPLTRLEFLRRFTQAERIAIRASTDPVIMDFIGLIDLAMEIKLDDPDTVAGTQYLEQQGLITEGRAEEIING